VLLTDSLEAAFLDEVATRFLGSVAAGLAPTGLALTLLTASSGPVLPAKELPLDGAIVYSCLPHSPSLDWLIRRKLPLVYVDQPPNPGHPSVNIDDRGGARAGARHLIELGHRRIAVLTSHSTGPHGVLTDVSELRDAFVAGERLQGWLEELGAVGVRPSIMVQPYAPDQGYADRLLDVDDPPTAVLCFSDAIALTVIEAARRRGLDVPRDLSVVGFDDAPMASCVSPALTTVAQDVDAKGRAAAAALVAQMAARRDGGDRNGSPDPAALRTVLPTTLVVRGSTAPPREG
jgi:DNA-binding LacI/PurR family transcriptional regulator